MSNTLWLINPHKRGTTGEKASMKKARTAKQIAATKKMLAARKKSLAAKAKTYAENPVKPLQKSLKLGDSKQPRTYTMKAKNGKKTTVTYKRNPISTNKTVQRGKGMLMENVKPAAMGAAAALGFDIVWGKMTFIPASLRAGNLKYPVKLLAALGLGIAAEKFLPKEHQKHVTTLVRGPLTVILHDAAKEFVQSKYPSLALAAYEADQMAEILEDARLNGYAYEENYQLEQPQLAETLQLQGINHDSGYAPFYAQPQYDGVAY